MKRFLALLMAMVMVFALAACGEDAAENGSSDVSTTTSDTATNESTDDNESSTTSGEAQSSETESSKDSSTATTSKQQATDNPATSSKDSTTSSKPSTNTSKPTTSSTPSTSKPSTSSTPEKAETKVSFDDIDVRSFYAMVMTDTAAKSLTAEHIINFCLFDICWSYVQVENNENVPANTIYEIAKEHFVVDEAFKQLLKTSTRYDSTTDTYKVKFGESDQYYMGWMAGLVKAYKDLGNSQYIIYGTCKEESLYDSGSVFDTVNYKTYTFKAHVSKSGDKTIVHTFEIVDSIPNGVTTY